jgi:hypothetical protein
MIWGEAESELNANISGLSSFLPSDPLSIFCYEFSFPEVGLNYLLRLPWEVKKNQQARSDGDELRETLPVSVVFPVPRKIKREKDYKSRRERLDGGLDRLQVEGTDLVLSECFSTDGPFWAVNRFHRWWTHRPSYTKRKRGRGDITGNLGKGRRERKVWYLTCPHSILLLCTLHFCLDIFGVLSWHGTMSKVTKPIYNCISFEKAILLLFSDSVSFWSILIAKKIQKPKSQNYE